MPILFLITIYNSQIFQYSLLSSSSRNKRSAIPTVVPSSPHNTTVLLQIRVGLADIMKVTHCCSVRCCGIVSRLALMAVKMGLSSFKDVINHIYCENMTSTKIRLLMMMIIWCICTYSCLYSL